MPNIRSIYERLASATDQAIFSATSFLLILFISYRYTPEELAGFGMGIAVGLALGGAYRTAFVVPLALSEEAHFTQNVSIQSTRHISILALFILSMMTSLYLFNSNSYYRLAILGTMANCTLYISIDYDRLLCYRILSYKKAWVISLLTSLAIILMIGIQLYSSIGYYIFCLIFTSFILLRTVAIALFVGGARLLHLRPALRAVLTNPGMWGACGTMASSGYGQLPAWTLALVCGPLNVASFSIARSLTQPLQIVIRSLDMIDKLTVGRLRKGSTIDTRRFIHRTYWLYCAISIFSLSLIAIFAQPLVELFFREQYSQTYTTLRWWCLVVFFVSTSAALESRVYSEGQFQQYAWFQFAGGALAMVASIPMSMLFQENGAVMSCALGWLIPYGWLLRRNFAER